MSELGAGPAATTPPGSHIADVVVLGSNARYYTGSEDVGPGGWSGWTLVPGLSLTATCRAAARPARWNYVIWVDGEQVLRLGDRPADHAVPQLTRRRLRPGHELLRALATLAAELHRRDGRVDLRHDDDADPLAPPISAPSIFAQTGTGWRAYEESMPSPCALTNSGLYAVRHNPAAYYTGTRAACQTQDLPLAATPDLGARFTFVTPNLCNDMHSCPVASGDRWLAGFVPKVLASPQYQGGDTVLARHRLGRERRGCRQPGGPHRGRAVCGSWDRRRHAVPPLQPAANDQGAARPATARRGRDGDLDAPGL